MELQRMKSPCTSSGKWRLAMNSAPEVGRTFDVVKVPSFPISFPCGTLIESGSA